MSAAFSNVDTVHGFLLTRQWRDTPDGLSIELWLATELGPVCARIDGERAVCFVDRGTELPHGVRAEVREVALKTLRGRDVDALYFATQRELVDAVAACAAQGIALHEADLKPSDRFLMERFVTGALCLSGRPESSDRYRVYRNPRITPGRYERALRWLSLDIETNGLDGELFSIAVYDGRAARAFVVSDYPVEADGCELSCHASERSLLEAFFHWLADHDPDVIIGWNLVNFDLDYLEHKCRSVGLRFAMGRGEESATILGSGGGRDGPRVARLPGRVALDGIELLRAAFWSFESYELEAVAQALLGRGKLIDGAHDRVAAIVSLYHSNRAALVGYNVEDCRLAADIFQAADLLQFARRRADITGLALDRLGGSVAAFDNLYLPRLHRRGRVAPSVSNVAAGGTSPGGYVLDSEPGIHDHVLVLDFKSLYPSIIRTFRIDPLGMSSPGVDPVPGFKGATFSRRESILPELIETLWRERDAAKRRGDAAMSQAVKILMNSFYGVLGASGCRFHDQRLASSITMRGHEVIRESQKRIEAEGYRVIYGATDSLFVLHGCRDEDPEVAGQWLAQMLNAWWRSEIDRRFGLESFLEIEFETHFIRFLMPTVRGESTGSKKRYAGLVRDDGGVELVFKGLESVRTDWTPLARRFQRELYRRVFVREPFEDYVRSVCDDLLAGKLDAELVYRKRIRRRVEDYTKNVPPHVQAARKLDTPVRTIRYVITRAGPEPVVDGRALPSPDYEHYRTRQLAPAADGILKFLDTSFAELTDAQLSMF